MIDAWVLPGLVFAGLAATLAVFAGFLVRSREIAPDREFRSLEKPGDFTDLPFVSIIVPARNEERNIGKCLDTLLALDYPRFEIIVVDDHSTDRTAARVTEKLRSSPGPADLRLLPLRDEPHEEGTEWTSLKSRGLWCGARRARGSWILFVDADTRLEPDCLWRVMSYALRHDLRALSLSGVNVNAGLWGGVLETVIYPAIFFTIPWRHVNTPGRPEAWMNGNMILYEKDAYFAVDGHRAVARYISDELALAVHSKARGVRYRFLPVSDAYECHDYAGLGEAFRGWVRRLAVGGARLHLPRRTYAAEVAGLFLVAVWPAPALGIALGLGFPGPAILGLGLGVWALIQLGLVVILQAGARASMNRPVWPAVFAPVGAALAIGVVAAGYRARFLTGVVEFRGRRLTVHDDVDEVPRASA